MGPDINVGGEDFVSDVGLAELEDSAMTLSADFAVAIDWGDGTSLTGGYVEGPGPASYEVYSPGDHVYAAPGF